jgi:hypothetical protein
VADFNLKDGWTFDRQEDGSIVMEKRAPVLQRMFVPGPADAHYPRKHGILVTRGMVPNPDLAPSDEMLSTSGRPYIVLERVTIDAHSWCSLMLAMSLNDETGATIEMAERFHAGETDHG